MQKHPSHTSRSHQNSAHTYLLQLLHQMLPNFVIAFFASICSLAWYFVAAHFSRLALEYRVSAIETTAIKQDVFNGFREENTTQLSELKETIQQQRDDIKEVRQDVKELLKRQ